MISWVFVNVMKLHIFTAFATDAAGVVLIE